MSEIGKKNKKCLPIVLLILWGIMGNSQTRGSEAKEKFYAKAIAFKESEICVLLAPEVKPPKEKQHEKAKISYSQDAGKSWTIIDIPYIASPANIAFDKDGNVLVWYLGQDTAIRGRSPFKSWEKISGHLPVWNERIWTSISGNLVCLASAHLKTDLKCLGELYESDDYGKSWRKLFYEDREAFYGYEQRKGMESFIKYIKRNDIVTVETRKEEGKDWETKFILKETVFGHDVFRFLGRSLLLAVTDTNMLSQTTFSADGGTNWTTVVIHPETLKDNPYVTDGILFSESKGIIVMSDRVMATKDAGKTWKCVWGPKKGCWLEKCYLSPNGEVWVIGNKVLKSTDGIKFKEVKIE